MAKGKTKAKAKRSPRKGPQVPKAPRKRAKRSTKAKPGGSVALRDRDPRKMGRRGLVHRADVVAAIVEAVERGNVLRVAAQAGGIREAALHDWRAKGEAYLEEALLSVPEEYRHELTFSELLQLVPEIGRDYAEFAERIARAIALAQRTYHDRLEGLTALTTSEDAADKRLALDALKFLLERRWPETYGRADRLELSGHDERPVALQIFLPQLQQGTDDAELMARSRGPRLPPSSDGDE